MFESFRAQLAYRPMSQKVALGVVGALVAGAVGTGVALAGRESGGPGRNPGTPIAESVTATATKNQMFGVILHTYSDRPQDDLLDRRLSGLATAAMRENAQLTLYLGDDAPEVHQVLLSSRRLSRKTDNPNEILPLAEAEAIRTEVQEKLRSVPAAPATSVSGALRLLAARLESARRSKADKVVGWLVGDAISTVKDCNFYVADMSPAATDDTARACLAPSPIDLGGAEIRMAGVGQDLSGATDSMVSTGTVAVVSRMIELSNGKPTLAYLDGGPTGVGAGR